MIQHRTARAVSGQGAEQSGRRAEAIASWWLRLSGYRVLARRYRSPVGEIDIIARKRRALVFVEVKRRGREGDGLAAVDPANRRRVTRAATHFLAGAGSAAGRAVETIRFDIIVVTPWRRPRHIRNAWIAGLDRTADAGW